MARLGVFAGPTEAYGVSMSFVHPADNDFLKGKYDPLLLDPRLQLTDKQRREIQAEIEQVTAVLKLGREKAGGA